MTLREQFEKESGEHAFVEDRECRCFNGKYVLWLEKRNAEMAEVLSEAKEGFEDWARISAPDFCESGTVKQARSRINERGTLGYIAHKIGVVSMAIIKAGGKL